MIANRAATYATPGNGTRRKAMFENIKKAVAEHEAQTVAKFAEEIQSKTAGDLLGSWYYREQMTPGTLEAMKQADQNKPAPADLLQKMTKRKAREEAKNSARRYETIRAAEEAHDARHFDIVVEWKKSRTWGANPHATITGDRVRTFGSASGCGYDKQSAAIAQAMNDNPEIMRVLCLYAETGAAFPYSVRTFAGVPFVDGGCGVECFTAVFDACGYSFRCVGSGDWFDCYTIEKKDGANR